MTNPFQNRAASLNGPALDIQPVTPNDAVDLPQIGVSLYVETGGTVAFETVAGQARTVAVGDLSVLPVGVQKVMSTGTTASGIHVFVVT
jgi:hypothetical protein